MLKVNHSSKVYRMCIIINIFTQFHHGTQALYSKSGTKQSQPFLADCCVLLACLSTMTNVNTSTMGRLP